MAFTSKKYFRCSVKYPTEVLKEKPAIGLTNHRKEITVLSRNDRL
jgi:hypothetical protein